MSFFDSWWRTRGIKPGDDITTEQFNDLYRAAKGEHKVRSTLKFIWAVIMGLCTIAAAIFSVLAYFK